MVKALKTETTDRDDTAKTDEGPKKTGFRQYGQCRTGPHFSEIAMFSRSIHLMIHRMAASLTAINDQSAVVP